MTPDTAPRTVAEVVEHTHLGLPLCQLTDAELTAAVSVLVGDGGHATFEWTTDEDDAGEWAA